jgi:hypothetical protein
MGGEPPICRVLRPDHCEEDRATHNLTERRERQEECAIKCRCEGKRRTLEKYTLSDSREEGE